MTQIKNLDCSRQFFYNWNIFFRKCMCFFSSYTFVEPEVLLKVANGVYLIQMMSCRVQVVLEKFWRRKDSRRRRWDSGSRAYSLRKREKEREGEEVVTRHWLSNQLLNHVFWMFKEVKKRDLPRSLLFKKSIEADISVNFGWFVAWSFSWRQGIWFGKNWFLGGLTWWLDIVFGALLCQLNV